MLKKYQGSNGAQAVVDLSEDVGGPVPLGHISLRFGVGDDAEEKLVGQVVERDAAWIDAALYGHVDYSQAARTLSESRAR